MHERAASGAAPGPAPGGACGRQTIWLVGMMGAGKSAVGRELSQRMGRRLVDTDERIVRRAGASIPEIFEREGEAAFRRLEREAIDEVAGRPVVAAVGGGAMAQPGLAERMAESGRVVYLRARVATLLRRVGRGQGRPLLADLDAGAREQRLRELLALRAPAYERAEIVIDTDDLDPADTARRVEALLSAEAQPAAGGEAS